MPQALIETDAENPDALTPQALAAAFQEAMNWYQQDPEGRVKDPENWKAVTLNGQPYSIGFTPTVTLALYRDEKDAAGYLQTAPEPPLAVVHLPDEIDAPVSPAQIQRDPD